MDRVRGHSNVPLLLTLLSLNIIRKYSIKPERVVPLNPDLIHESNEKRPVASRDLPYGFGH